MKKSQQVVVRVPNELKVRAVKVGKRMKLGEGAVWRRAMEMLLDGGDDEALMRLRAGRWTALPIDPKVLLELVAGPIEAAVREMLVRRGLPGEEGRGAG